MGEYIRARSAEHKRERMDAIMAAADKLFQTHPYHCITMGTIADELGWSRSNLYKYAATQEEIFLALHSAKNRAYLQDLEAKLAGVPLPPDEFARIWAQVTGQHGDFLRYQDIVIAIIESNVTFERLVEFKREFKEILDPIVDVLVRQCGVSAEQAADLYLRLLFQAPGLYNHYHCAEKTLEAMKAAGLDGAKGTFEEAYADFVHLCISRA